MQPFRKSIVILSGIALLAVLGTAYYRVYRTQIRSREMLIEAAREGDAAKAEAALKTGISPETLQPNPGIYDRRIGPALIEASMQGHLDVVRVLLKYGAQVNLRSRGEYAGRLHVDISLSDSVNPLENLCGTTIDIYFNDGIRSDRIGVTALMHAAAGSHREIVDELLAHGADVHAQSQDGATALTFAAIRGNADIVQSLLRHGANVDVRTQNGQTPLMFASWNQNRRVKTDNTVEEFEDTRILEYLLAAGANANARDKDGNTPLIGAAGLQKTKADVDLLLAYGADPNARNKDGWTAFLNAAKRGHCDTLRRLIEAGVPLDQRTENGETALMVASPGVIRLLVENSVDINAQNKAGMTVLMKYARTENVEMVRTLLSLGAKIELRDLRGRTAFIHSIQSSHTNIAQVLLEKGADLEARDNRGWTALMYASESSYKPDIVQLLLRRNANVHHQIAAGESALLLAARNTEVKRLKTPEGIFYHLKMAGAGTSSRIDAVVAVRTGDIERLRQLLTTGLSPDTRGIYNQTLLNLAAQAGQAEVVKFLIAAGANIDLQDYDGYTPLMWGAYNGHLVVVEALLTAGAKVNSQSRREETALSLAAHHQTPQIVRALLAAGASVHLKNKDGKPVVSRPGPFWDKETDRLLVKAGLK